MSKKKPTKPNTPNSVSEQKTETSPAVTTTVQEVTAMEYVPSVNAEKYPEIKTPSYSYKILAFKNDYIRLQEEVTKHLNTGWNLAGGIATTLHADNYATVTIFAQAVYKQA